MVCSTKKRVKKINYFQIFWLFLFPKKRVKKSITFKFFDYFFFLKNVLKNQLLSFFLIFFLKLFNSVFRKNAKLWFYNQISFFFVCCQKCALSHNTVPRGCIFNTDRDSVTAFSRSSRWWGRRWAAVRTGQASLKEKTLLPFNKGLEKKGPRGWENLAKERPMGASEWERVLRGRGGWCSVHVWYKAPAAPAFSAENTGPKGQGSQRVESAKGLRGGMRSLLADPLTLSIVAFLYSDFKNHSQPTKKKYN